MPTRYYIFAEIQDVQVLRNKLVDEGYKLHKRGGGISRHFHIDDVTLYLREQSDGSLTKNVVEFEDDEGDMSKLEEIASMLNAKKVTDSMSQNVKFNKGLKPEKGL